MYMHRVKEIDILKGVCCRLLVFSCAGPGIFVRKTSSLQGSGRGSIIFQVVHLLISMETYVTCCFQGDEGPDPLPSFGSAHSSSLKLSSHTYVFFTLC